MFGWLQLGRTMLETEGKNRSPRDPEDILSYEGRFPL
jgi:hypothetical protein